MYWCPHSPSVYPLYIIIDNFTASLALKMRTRWFWTTATPLSSKEYSYVNKKKVADDKGQWCLNETCSKISNDICIYLRLCYLTKYSPVVDKLVLYAVWWVHTGCGHAHVSTEDEVWVWGVQFCLAVQLTEWVDVHRVFWYIIRFQVLGTSVQTHLKWEVTIPL